MTRHIELEVCDFLLVCHCNSMVLSRTLFEMLSYWIEPANFSYPSLIRHSRSLCSLGDSAVK